MRQKATRQAVLPTELPPKSSIIKRPALNCTIKSEQPIRLKLDRLLVGRLADLADSSENTAYTLTQPGYRKGGWKRESGGPAPPNGVLGLWSSARGYRLPWIGSSPD